MSEQQPRAHDLTRREFVAAGAASLCGAPAIASRQPPNLLFIHTDQQFGDALSANGCRHVRTPNMDRLIARGVSFHESYSANPVCCPARAAWYTGRPPSENGVVQNDRFPLREDVPDLGQWFRDQGWDAAYAGKWHVTGRDLARSFRVLTYGFGLGEHGDASVARAAREFLRSRRTSERPFFLSVGFLQPHDICYWIFAHTERMAALPYPEIERDLVPIWPNFRFDAREPESFRANWRSGPTWHHLSQWEEWQWRYYRWSYYRNIEMVDAHIGTVLDALEETGRDRDTVVVFSADHGDGMGAHMLWQKMFFYEEVARVPFLVAWPGEVDTGKHDRDHLVSGLDVAPTLCDFAGIPAPPHCRGRSLRPLLSGRPTEWREFLVSEAATTGRMVRTPGHKLIKYRGDRTEQLFDMRADRGEMHNLIGDANASGVAADMRRLLADWESHLDASPAGSLAGTAWAQPG